MSLSSVTAVVVAYNAKDRLQATIDGVLAQGVAEVLVIDSGSTDGSVDLVRGARVVRFAHNVGPGVTRNRGLLESTSEFVLWVDDDMELAPGTVAALHAELLANPRAVMAGPVIYEAGARERVQYAGGDPHFCGLSAIFRTPPAPARSGRESGLLTSGCLLVRREPMLASGGFFEPFFYLMEDVELSLRMRALGHELRLVPAAAAWNRGASEGLSLSPEGYPAKRAYWQARNRWMLLMHQWSLHNLMVLAGPLLFFELVHLGFGGLSGHLGPILRGKVDAIRERRGVRASRRQWQSFRRVPERAMLGAPPLSLSSSASRVSLVGRLSHVVDGALRLGFLAIRGWLT